MFGFRNSGLDVELVEKKRFVVSQEGLFDIANANGYNSSSFDIACYRNYLVVVENLLARGHFHPDFEFHDGSSTPLSAAAMNGFVESLLTTMPK